MFKFTLKLIFASIALSAVFMSLGTDKASAAAWNSCFFGNGDDFGVTVAGQHNNEMGGLKVQAQYASGAPVENVNYTLKSDVPGNHPPTINGQDYDARIFAWPIGNGRAKEKTFTIGENLSPGNFSCPGKSVLGPGIPGERGNKWVLDCNQKDKPVDFWIDSIQNPSGKKGTWTYLFEGQTYSINHKFNIVNGDNVRIDLIFTPEEPAGQIQSVECDRVRLIGYMRSDPSRYVRFLLLRGNGSLVVDSWTNQANQPHWYNTGLGGTFDASYPNNVTLRLLIDTGGGVFQQVDSWQGRKSCSGGGDTPNCTHVNFRIPNDSQSLSGTNRWNTPANRSYYAVYVNDWGSPGRPAPAGSPDYYPNGSGSPAGSGKYNESPGPWVDYSSYDHGSESVSEGQTIERNLREHNKVVSGQLVWTLVVYDWFQNSSGVWRIQVQHRETHEVNNCFQATCEIQINGNVPGREGSDAMIAGSTLRGTVRIRNTGVNNLPSWMITNGGTFGLSLTTNYRGGLSPNHLNEAIPPGGEIVRSLEDFGLTAPNDIGPHSIDLYPDYWGRAGIGPWCNKGFRTFKEFNIRPSAGTLSLTFNGVEDEEDPNTAAFNWVVNNVASNRADVSIPTTRNITKNGGSIPPYPKTDSFTFGDVSHTDLASITGSKLGDQYCGRISVSPVRGWQGPGGDRHVLDAGPRTDGECRDVVNHPYVRAYGSDIVAGSNFMADEVCNANVKRIDSYISTHADKSGSGVQLAAIAMGTIESFSTASLRTSSPTALTGLSFGNTPNPVGQYAGQPLCSTNFYGETQSNDDNPTDDAVDTVNKNTVGDHNISPGDYLPNYGQTLVTNPSHQVTLGGDGSFNGKKIIYVDGDVTITGNIAYQPFTDPTEAPAFMLVAKGNIYIGKNVTRLDGLYVAQAKDDASGGIIFTCARPGDFAAYNDNEKFDNCGGPEGENSNPPDDKRLIVNGSFIANNIRLDRIHKSVRDSKSNINEKADRDPSATPHNTEASEVFNFSPEMYLSQPPFAKNGTSSSSSTIFQYYTTLPPIL